MDKKMSSVLFSRGTNGQSNNPLRTEITRVIGLSTALEKRVFALEREVAELKKTAPVAGPTGPAGPAGPKGDPGTT
jgi:hypothetical protein